MIGSSHIWQLQVYYRFILILITDFMTDLYQAKVSCIETKVTYITYTSHVVYISDCVFDTRMQPWSRYNLRC